MNTAGLAWKEFGPQRGVWHATIGSYVLEVSDLARLPGEHVQLYQGAAYTRVSMVQVVPRVVGTSPGAVVAVVLGKLEQLTADKISKLELEMDKITLAASRVEVG